MQTIAFSKYHGLGNDYLVIEPEALEGALTGDLARRICDRHYGVGADGILYGPLASGAAEFGLLIFNPDGSQAEKSGNGLRIFARYLWERGQARQRQFTVSTAGGIVQCQVQGDGSNVQVEIGRAAFDDHLAPADLSVGEFSAETLELGEQRLSICALSLGNPHCVVLDREATPAVAHRLGPLIENHPRFPRRTNVQFLQVLDRFNLRIEIWERGAGYTLASGSSACAAAAAALRLGWGASQVTVHMPGGALQVEIAPDGMITLSGPVQKVCEGVVWVPG